MRTVADIKLELTTAFISNSTIINLYGLIAGQTFEQQFSIVSLENILFDVFSYCLWTHEKIVSKNAENSRPHTIRWYREQCLNFLDGLPLVWKDGFFQYDLTSVIDVETRKIIDRCAILESQNGELVIKVATDNAGVLQPLTASQLVRFKAYLQQIKDAGNRLRFINQSADLLKITLTVHVDPLIIDLTTGQLLSSSAAVFPVKDAIDKYLANLEFNGAFVREFFRDELQRAEGVKLPIINDLKSQFGGFAFVAIDQMKVPEAGYFAVNPADLTINYEAYVLGIN